LIDSRGIFECIHESVEIPQKEVDYRPTDKLVLVVLGIMSGCEVMFDLNRKFRVDRVLLRAFGYGGATRRRETDDSCFCVYALLYWVENENGLSMRAGNGED